MGDCVGGYLVNDGLYNTFASEGIDDTGVIVDGALV
jgi:hypothetical protein